MPVFQPSNVIKLTNASVVRQKKAGKRFEIVCYKNKVKDWRAGNEKDLDEVLQISQVFTNVSKGQVASAEELSRAFGAGKSVDDIVLLILRDGELQVGDKERGHELESLRKEVCTIVAEKCVDPTTGRPHTASMIEKAMHQIHFGVQTNKSAKSQALDLIKAIQEADAIPLARTQMRIRLTIAAKEYKRLKDQLLPLLGTIEDEDADESYEITSLIEPGSLKAINDLLAKEVKTARGDDPPRLETLNVSVTDFQETAL